MRSVKHVARIREKRNAYKILLGKLEGKSPFGKPPCRSEGDTKTGSMMSGCELDSCSPGYAPVAGFCEHGNILRVPLNLENLLIS
jgi:hypothetical protein